jgi:hypothetical protein
MFSPMDSSLMSDNSWKMTATPACSESRTPAKRRAAPSITISPPYVPCG